MNTKIFDVSGDGKIYDENMEREIANIIASCSEKMDLNKEIHYVITNVETLRIKLIDYINGKKNNR